MTKKDYTLYYNSVDKDIIKPIIEEIQSINISCDVAYITEQQKDALRGVAKGGIALYCYFVSNTYNDVRPSASKICTNGLGLGVSIFSINISEYYIENKENKDELIALIKDRLKNSIQWCEEHLNVDYD